MNGDLYNDIMKYTKGMNDRQIRGLVEYVVGTEMGLDLVSDHDGEIILERLRAWKAQIEYEKEVAKATKLARKTNSA